MSDAVEPKVTKAGGSKILPLLLGVNSLLLCGVLAMLVLNRSAPAKGAGEHGGGGEHAAKAEHGGGEHEGGGEKSGEHGGGEKGEGVAPGSVGPMVRLPDFVVHLRNPEADRFARISFEVETSSDLDKAAITARLPKIRDTFLAYLSDRTLEELRGSEGLEKTKLALKDKLAALAPGVSVRGLYVTDLVVQ